MLLRFFRVSKKPPTVKTQVCTCRQFVTHTKQVFSSAIMLGNAQCKDVSLRTCVGDDAYIVPTSVEIFRIQQRLALQGVLTYCTNRTLPYLCTPTGSICLSRRLLCPLSVCQNEFLTDCIPPADVAAGGVFSVFSFPSQLYRKTRQKIVNFHLFGSGKKFFVLYYTLSDYVAQAIIMER